MVRAVRRRLQVAPCVLEHLRLVLLQGYYTDPEATSRNTQNWEIRPIVCPGDNPGLLYSPTVTHTRPYSHRSLKFRCGNCAFMIGAMRTHYLLINLSLTRGLSSHCLADNNTTLFGLGANERSYNHRATIIGSRLQG
jgi:hypothetical protein